MWIWSTAGARHALAIFLSLAILCNGEEKQAEDEDLSSAVLDLLSLETAEIEKTVQDSTNSKDEITGEESKTAFIIRHDHKPNKPPQRKGQENNTDASYNVVQWFTTPTQKSEIRHHVDGLPAESNIDNQREKDFSMHSFSYDGNYGSDHSGEHYHANDDHDHDGHPSPHSYRHSDGSGEVPRSTYHFKKLKVKKGKRNCTHPKDKKGEGWPDNSDTIVHSRSNTVHHYDSRISYNSENNPEGRFNNVPQSPGFGTPRNHAGFSGEHLHGIPRTNFFSYKSEDGGNHFHLHNHHHIYDPNAKKNASPGHEQTYRNIIHNFEKLKHMMEDKGPGIPSYPGLTGSARGPEGYAPENSETQKRGYHYTGPHESYGRKTYKRIEPSNPDTYPDDKSIGADMFRYGAGQYGTDEFHDNGGRYPNEVSVDSGERYGPNYDKQNYGTSSGERYNPDIPPPPSTPYHPHSGEYDSSSYHNGKDEKYDLHYDSKVPYAPQGDIRGGVPEQYDLNQPKAPYEPQREIRGNPPGKLEHGYGINEHEPGNLGNGYPYDGHFDHEGKNNLGPSHDLGGIPGPNGDVPHSISYSNNPNPGSVEQEYYGPENEHLYKNLRPEPDPLAIPRNARVIEHHIRLHPMHYMYPQIPMEIGGNSHPPVPPAPAFGRQNYPPAPIPLHKLIPNPLKMPQRSFVPPAPAYTHPRLNQMLQAYQSRSLHHRWW